MHQQHSNQKQSITDKARTLMFCIILSA